MMTVVHFIKFTIRLLLLVILLPFIALWVGVKYYIFKSTLIRALSDSGMPSAYAKMLAREMWIMKFASVSKAVL